MKTRIQTLPLTLIFSVLMVNSAMLGGCTGTYRTALQEYAKPDHERLAVRLKEVSRQQQASRKEIGRVMQFIDRFGQDDGETVTMSRDGLQIKFDRAELHAWNTRRRLLAVQDSAARYFSGSYDPTAIDADYVAFMLERHDRGLGAAMARLNETQDTIEAMLEVLNETTPARASGSTGPERYLALDTLREQFKVMTQKTIDTQLETKRFAASLRSAETVRIADGMPR